MAVKQAKSTHNLLLRLDPELHSRLSRVADIEGKSVAEVCRDALADHVERRYRSAKFRQLVEQNIARNQDLLRILDAR